MCTHSYMSMYMCVYKINKKYNNIHIYIYMLL